ncbi:MAG: DUF1549 domain-containing protein [Planctomycetaceae bacterium]|nr:DUF1549 domain-containing protein [Planctomycetaceae bacterium]
MSFLRASVLCLMIMLCRTTVAVDDAVPSFRNDVMAVLTRSGCSLGTCHGNQNGKGGFRISLRGQDPESDFVTLTRQLGARRTNLLAPEESLLLQKPSMQVPHEGGRRFAPTSHEYQILRNWIAAGMPADANTVPTLVRLTVDPSKVTLEAPENSVALHATAEFSDGSQKNVNHLAVFESSDPSIQVQSSGEIRFADSTTARQTSVTVRYLNQQTVARVEYVPDQPGFVFDAPASNNPIDQAVFSQLQRLKINPSPVCDDATFLRRVFLDVTGLLPSEREAREFVSSTDPGKRDKLIDRLLASQEYTDFQSLRWADLLRVEDKTLDSKGVEVFYQWIRESVASDKPLNQFCAEIVEARGSTYSHPPTNFYRALRTPEERAESAAQVFLGIRLQCARCHNHPFDRWTQDDYYGWTNFFARVDYKILENRRRDENDKHEFDGEQVVVVKDEGDVRNPTTGRTISPRFLGNAAADPSAFKGDRLQVLGQWLSDPANDRFVATQANRIWYQLLGIGVVDPIDDFRNTNPPSNPELLDVLKQEFVKESFRVRPLMSLILKSKTYQLSSESNRTNIHDAVLFSHTIPRRLTAEQMLDTMAQVVETSVRFGGYPEGTRAVQLAGVRNGGHRYSRPEAGDRFLALFGKPSRLQTCECERTGETTLAQTMEMVAGNVVTELLKESGSRIDRSMSSNQTTDEFIGSLWWTALSRNPTEAELHSMRQHVATAKDRRLALQDIAWAVLNSNEFLLRQ